MPVGPKLRDVPRIRSAFAFYRVSSFVTGTFLLLLVLMMIFRYGFLSDIELAGPAGFLALTPREFITGINLSTVILIVHGWLYVLYLIADFRLWSVLRWPFWRFLLVALGGVIPFLSFFLEQRVHQEVRTTLATLETSAEATH